MVNKSRASITAPRADNSLHRVVIEHALKIEKSLLVGTHADAIVGMPGPHARALLCRLQEWASQPDYAYTHDWKLGDLLIWNNEGVMHRVTPYTDETRVVHRTSLAGGERPGHIAPREEILRLLEAVD